MQSDRSKSSVSPADAHLGRAGLSARASASFDSDQENSSSEQDVGSSLPDAASRASPYISSDESSADEAGVERRRRWEHPVGSGYTPTADSRPRGRGRLFIRTNGAGARGVPDLKTPRQLAAEARHAARMAAALQARRAEPPPLPRPVQVADHAAHVPPVHARNQAVAVPGPLTPTIAAR